MIQPIIIGSLAGERYQIGRGDIKDIDIIIRPDDLAATFALFGGLACLGPAKYVAFDAIEFREKLLNVEIEVAWPGTAAGDLFERLKDVTQKQIYVPKLGFGCILPKADWLYAFKDSHKFAKDSSHFYKTMRDWRSFRQLGCKIPDQSWLKKREDETYKHQMPKLNVDKSTFFSDDGVQYTYDHDSIHEAMKHLHVPAYMLYKSDKAEVMCDKVKWDACTEQIKLLGVLEEAYVLAIERSQVPFPGVNPKRSFMYALMKVCTSITGGYFRAYAYEHHDKVVAKYDPEYMNRFRAAVTACVVKPYYRNS